jgi:alpha-1,2-mannosyltransferase
MALVSALCETYFYRAVCREFGVNTGRLTLGALVFGAGMFVSSTAFLPSSFGMMTAMVAIGSWYLGNIPVAVFATALGALVGWPFTGALGIPIAVDVVLRRREIWLFLRWSLFSLAACLIPVVCIDSYYYGGLVIAPWNILVYNVFTEHGPNIYGVEPWSYYFVNGFLNFNIVFLLALACLPFVMLVNYLLSQPRRGIPLWLSLSPMYIWILIFFTRPHKEERFLFPVYPLFCLLASVLVDHIQKLYSLLVYKGRDMHYTWSSRWLPSLVGIVYVVGCLSRMFAIFYGYHAPLDVFGELHQRAVDHSELVSPSQTKVINICIGKEWYRFPSNFFLPDDRWQLQFVKSKFSGQLPKPYSRLPPPEGTRIFPSQMNDANLEEPSRYVNISSCHYLVDVDVPDEAENEPRYVQLTKDWQVLITAKFLDNPRSHRFFRAFFIPFVSRHYVSYVNYNILVSAHVNSKLFRI